MKQTLVLLAMLLLTSINAQAQQQQFYDAAGRNAGRAVTDSQGSTTFYDANGNVTGRASTGSSGTTTIYDANGRRTGTVTTQPPAAPRR
jgi:YD repeat-containing protein